MEVPTPPHVPRYYNRQTFLPPLFLIEDLNRRYSSIDNGLTNNRRRPSVSGESIRPSENSNRIIVPKSLHIRHHIDMNTQFNLLFKNLDHETKLHVIDAMRQIIVKKNETIIAQGEKGYYFYFIEHGLFQIFKDDKLVLEIANGSTFGELALMYDVPRAATVIAKTDGILWGIDRETFQLTISNSRYRKKKTYETFLKSVSFLSSLTFYEIAKLAEALEIEYYADGDTIISQGDPGDTFYIIERGQVSVSRITEEGNQIQLPSLSAGGYFGESALLPDNPRRLTVVAKGSVCVISLKRDALIHLLGPAIDIIRRNVQQNMEPFSVPNQSPDNAKKRGYSGAGGVEILQKIQPYRQS